LLRDFPFYRQLDSNDCGPTCLRIVAKYHGRTLSLPQLRAACPTRKIGITIADLEAAAQQVGFPTRAVKVEKGRLDELPMPWIAHWRERHFVVVYRTTADSVFVADPATGRIRYSREDFTAGWIGGGTHGAALLIESPRGEAADAGAHSTRANFRLMLQHLTPYKRQFVQLGIGMLVSSLLLLTLPFFARAMIDVGIANKDLRFIYSLLIAQVMIFAGRTTIDFLRTRMLLHIGTRLNIAIISDFIAKLMRLPLTFFESRMIGDIMQRVGDLQRLQSFLTVSTVTTVFSILNLIVFGITLLLFSPMIFVVFMIGSVLSVGWLLAFAGRRRIIDYRRFDQLSQNSNHLAQVVGGMQEIKLHGAEEEKREVWETLQTRLYKLEINSLSVNQTQLGGSMALNELRSIAISVMAATQVVQGHLTLGMMMAITYLAGQLSSPIESLLSFMQTAQDAKLSLERVTDVQNMPDEPLGELPAPAVATDIHLRGVSVAYGSRTRRVLDDLTLTIPAGKTTAIVGESGSGKTTLMKLLLKMLEPLDGQVLVGDVDLQSIDSKQWRGKCGAVMQDGYLFADTIARNIGIGSEEVDEQRLRNAARLAGIDSFIASLQHGFQTRLGANGAGLSQGQRQRVLIARAVYRNPEYLLFDEATSSLDSTTEKVVLTNLNEFFRGRTVIFVAHRLSTVRNADQIIVLSDGRIIERGTHAELIRGASAYLELVRNQLELGN
jgi:ATP-binding cassette subfamily B protein